LAVSLRRLFAVLLALSMTFAPLGMPAMAEATPPAALHGAMAAHGHCDQQQPVQQHKAADKSCCAAMCIAVVGPTSTADLPSYHPDRERPVSDLDRRGFLDEIATPPPKFA
jgi:hypothetical protein